MAYSGPGSSSGGAGGDFDSDPSVTSAEELLASLEMNSIPAHHQQHQGQGVGDMHHGNYQLLSNQPRGVNQPTDWNYSQNYSSSGPGTNDYNNRQLLPPLRRPDINQIPADVLGLLLKSERFTELLGDRSGSGIGQQGHGNNMPPTPYAQGPQQHQQYRMNNSPRPYQNSRYPSPNQMNAPHTPPRPNNQSPTRQFVPSPHAREFVPRNSPSRNYSPRSPYNTSPHQQSQQYADPTAMLAMAVAQVNFEQFRDQPSNIPYIPDQRRSYNSASASANDPNAQGSDPVLDCVVETIAYLTSNPGEFGLSSKKLIRVLSTAIPTRETGNEALITETLTVIITLIIEQSIAQRNFSYTGARLCDLLRENKIGGKIQKGDTSIVQKLVLSRVQEVFQIALNGLNSENSDSDATGVIYFLAELFKNFQMDTGPKGQFFGFGIATLELMQKLLKRGKSNDIKLVCTVLKLIGYDLDMHENRKLQTQMQDFMKDLDYILSMESEIRTPDDMALISKIIDLRKANWGRETSSSNSSQADPSETPDIPQGSQYYELPDSEDETFDIEDEPDIVSQCYEEFLSGLPTKK